MTNQEIKNIFDQQWDAYASGIIEDADLDSIFQKSTQVVLKKLYNQLDLDNSFTTELVPLIKETVLATTDSTINVVDDLPATDPYERLINLQVTYTVGGVVYTKIAQPLNDSEVISPYSQGTYRYPRYRYLSTANGAPYTGNQGVISIFPQINITSKNVRYFRDLYPYDFGDAAFLAATSFYGNMTNEMIIDNALQIAANAYRENGFFQTQTAVQANDNRGI
jgi:hypothetical protein